MPIVKVFPNELQDAHSLAFLYCYVSTSCEQNNCTKMILFNTSHSPLMFKSTDVP